MSLVDDLEKAVNAGLEAAKIEQSNSASTVDPVAHVVNAIRKEFGGRRIYVPAPSKTPRNREILRRWREKVPRKQIAKEFDLSESAVSAIIGAHLATPRRRSRCGFGTEEWSL